jgi:argininosuccinate lyase
MLAHVGILTGPEADAICRGLDQIRGEIERGELRMDPQLEDIHMNVESRLTQLVGEAGKKLHTARSRNDQIATDLRLWSRARAAELGVAVDAQRGALTARAKENIDVVMPGYTHLQRAQPVRLAHYLLAYQEMFARDRERLRDAAARGNRSPLGSGALAGTPFPIDREHTARALGFDGITANSMDAVADRDFAVELVFACALLQTHLSRLGEELVLWASQEFGFARLPEGYCSGSSIMPQKINPDIPELVRGKAGRVTGDLVALLTVCKGLPLAYSKDLQETQEPLYDAVTTALSSTRVMTGVVEGTEFDAARMRAACDAGYLNATEIADWLAARGVPFRTAHDVAGSLVRKASARKVQLHELTLADFQSEWQAFDDSIYKVLDPEVAVERRNLPGGPARAAVLHEIARIEKELAP